jgi:hypothetical protein
MYRLQSKGITKNSLLIPRFKYIGSLRSIKAESSRMAVTTQLYHQRQSDRDTKSEDDQTPSRTDPLDLPKRTSTEKGQVNSNGLPQHLKDAVALLKDTIMKIRAGEEVDVRKTLGTGDPQMEKTWRDCITFIILD